MFVGRKSLYSLCWASEAKFVAHLQRQKRHQYWCDYCTTNAIHLCQKDIYMKCFVVVVTHSMRPIASYTVAMSMIPPNIYYFYAIQTLLFGCSFIVCRLDKPIRCNNAFYAIPMTPMNFVYVTALKWTKEPFWYSRNQNICYQRKQVTEVVSIVLFRFELSQLPLLILHISKRHFIQ